MSQEGITLSLYLCNDALVRQIIQRNLVNILLSSEKHILNNDHCSQFVMYSREICDDESGSLNRYDGTTVVRQAEA